MDISDTKSRMQFTNAHHDRSRLPAPVFEDARILVGMVTCTEVGIIRLLPGILASNRRYLRHRAGSTITEFVAIEYNPGYFCNYGLLS